MINSVIKAFEGGGGAGGFQGFGGLIVRHFQISLKISSVTLVEVLQEELVTEVMI